MFTENIALRQPTWQNDAYHTADLAVDGQYTDLDWAGDQCAESFSGQTAEWGVDLGGGKNIHHVRIHHVKSKSISGIISFQIIDCYLK